jgi:Resolvase, N terminal domain
MLRRLAANGAKTIIVESPDRFARDLAVQLAGHDMLKGLGIAIIPASAPDFFTEDTPTAVLVRQVLGAIAQFGRLASLRSWQQLGNASAIERDGAREGSLSARRDPRLSLSPVACAGVGPRVGKCHCAKKELAARGFLNERGKPYAAKSVCCGSSELRRLTYHRHKHR